MTRNLLLLSVLVLPACQLNPMLCQATPPTLTQTVHYTEQRQTVIPDDDLAKLLYYITELEECAGV